MKRNLKTYNEIICNSNRRHTKWTQLTSLDRKTRAINSQDIASQFNLKDKKSIKNLKSKNSELLAKYREKLKNNNISENNNEFDVEESTQDLELDSEKKLIPKVNESFQGVVFDDKHEDVEIPDTKRKKSWRKGKKRNTKGDSEKKSRFNKFKPFNRSTKTKGKKD